MTVEESNAPPILSHKHYGAASAFKPENLLREARRQKGLPGTSVPEICILDPDGDMVRYLCNAGRASRHPGWACYHTDLHVFREGGHETAFWAAPLAPRLPCLSPRNCSRPGAGCS